MAAAAAAARAERQAEAEAAKKVAAVDQGSRRGGRQRETHRALNRERREQDAGGATSTSMSDIVAASLRSYSAEERQRKQREVDEAALLARGLQASLEHAEKGDELDGAFEIYSDLLAGVRAASEEVKLVGKTRVSERVKTMEFARRGRNVGIDVREDGRMEQLQQARRRATAFLESKFGVNWQAQVERNLQEWRRRHGNVAT